MPTPDKPQPLPEDLPRASEGDTLAFLERQGITADNADTFDLARVLVEGHEPKEGQS